MKKGNRNNSSTRFSRALLISALVCLLLSGLTLISQEVKAQNLNRYRITIKNNTEYEVHKIYLSATESNNWGPDRLGRNGVLANADSLTLTDIRPGAYDIKFVDEDGDECILRNVKILKNTRWSLTNDWLIECQNR